MTLEPSFDRFIQPSTHAHQYTIQRMLKNATTHSFPSTVYIPGKCYNLYNAVVALFIGSQKNATICRKRKRKNTAWNISRQHGWPRRCMQQAHIKHITHTKPILMAVCVSDFLSLFSLEFNGVSMNNIKSNSLTYSHTRTRTQTHTWTALSARRWEYLDAEQTFAVKANFDDIKCPQGIFVQKHEHEKEWSCGFGWWAEFCWSMQ